MLDSQKSNHNRGPWAHDPRKARLIRRLELTRRILWAITLATWISLAATMIMGALS